MQEYPKKCRLVLTQPDIKCGGRGDVSCHYRGVIEKVNGDLLTITFKYKGETLTEDYHIHLGFINEEISDIKLK